MRKHTEKKLNKKKIELNVFFLHFLKVFSLIFFLFENNFHFHFNSITFLKDVLDLKNVTELKI